MSQIFGATEVKCDQNRFTYKQQGRSYGRASAVAGSLGRNDGDKLALNAPKKSISEDDGPLTRKTDCRTGHRLKIHSGKYL